MKAKFIKQDDPRHVLGINLISKRNFKDLYEFVDWVVDVFIPHYYSTRNLEDTIERFQDGLENSNVVLILPDNLYRSIRDLYVNEIKIGGRTHDKISPRILLEIRERMLSGI